MTRALGAGLAADIAAPSADRCQFIFMDWADLNNDPTPVYVTTAPVDIDWGGHTWESVGGQLDLDALGESAEDPSKGHRLKLSGVDQSFISLILGSRCRGRMATIYHVGIDRALGTVKTDPVVMFSGPMNGGFQIHESRSHKGGTVEVSANLTSRLDELVKVRGIRTNAQSHQSAPIAGVSGDTFFQNVDNLVNRRVFWGLKTPTGPQTNVPNPNDHGGTTNPPAPPRVPTSGDPTGGGLTNNGGPNAGGPSAPPRWGPT